MNLFKKDIRSVSYLLKRYEKKSFPGRSHPHISSNNQLFRIMKITSVLLFTFIFNLSAVTSKSQNVKVTIKRDHSSVQQVIQDIEKQTEYLFIVNSNVDTRRSVSIDASETPLSEVLDKLSRQAEVNYSVSGSHIILTKEVKAREAVQATAQQPLIRGVVVDDTGEPLIGVNVKVKGETQGAISDLDGNFELAASVGHTLVFSYVGYVTEELKLTSQNPLKVVLREDSHMLDEVVAIGYGTVKRKDITGSVVSLDNSKIASVPVNSPVEAMAGKLAGVKVTIPEGNPDADVIIRVRGGGSITSDNSPLFIVDGFPVNSISDIPATDIESIDVLKDASSTAIYGSRGSNGIVLVTTKSGQKGKVSVNYNAYYSMRKVASKMDVLDVYDYMN